MRAGDVAAVQVVAWAGIQARPGDLDPWRCPHAHPSQAEAAQCADGAPPGRVWLGAQLRRWREQAGMGVADGARVLGCSPPKISRLEHGLMLQDPPEVHALLAAYGCSAVPATELMAAARELAAYPGRRPGRPRGPNYRPRRSCRPSVVAK